MKILVFQNYNTARNKSKSEGCFMQEEENFETLIEQSKNALVRLGNPDLTLKESLEIYKNGLDNLNRAQKLLENAKLEYEMLNPPKTIDDSI